MFGKAVLGEKDYAKQKASAPQGLGAAVQFGKRVMGRGPNAVPVVAPPPPAPKTAAKPQAKGKPKPKAPQYSEAEVIEMLTADPKRWQELLAVEAARKDGPRSAVLARMLEQADQTDPPMPLDYRVEMRRLLGIGEGDEAPVAADAPPSGDAGEPTVEATE